MGYPKELFQVMGHSIITQSTSSPTYPQTNGLAEKTVLTVKMLLTKAKQSGHDPYIASLNYRSTPVGGIDSPARDETSMNFDSNCKKAT